VPREAGDEVAAKLEVGVEGVVAPPGDRVVVEARAVDFHDQPVGGPEEVDVVGAERRVDERFRQAADHA
jgi:hypothetical protein